MPSTSYASYPLGTSLGTEAAPLAPGAVHAAGLGQLGYVLAQTPQGLVLVPASAICGGGLAMAPTTELVSPQPVGLAYNAQQQQVSMLLQQQQLLGDQYWQQQQQQQMLAAEPQAGGRQPHKQQPEPLSHGQALGGWQGQQQRQMLVESKTLQPGGSPCASKQMLSPRARVRSIIHLPWRVFGKGNETLEAHCNICRKLCASLVRAMHVGDM